MRELALIESAPGMNTDTAQIYTDLSGVQQLKAQSKTDKAGALKNIAHQFEAMMVQMMMKSMRDANAAFADGDMTASSDQKFYQDMFDNQLSLSLSKGRGFGIAEALMRQMQDKSPSPSDPLGPLGRGVRGEGNAVENSALTPTLSRREREFDRSIGNVHRVQALVNSAANGNSENSHMTAAIQDALHALFGEIGESENAASAPVALDGTPTNFVESLRPLAQKIAAALGVDRDVLLSQAALETGWGQKVIQCADGSSSFNFFNIKADGNWNGAVVKVPTIEYQNGVAVRQLASFRAYNSPEESFADYARLVSENPRYQAALDCATDPRAYIKALAGAGYATDPRYANKVLALYDGEHVRGTAAVVSDQR